MDGLPQNNACLAALGYATATAQHITIYLHFVSSVLAVIFTVVFIHYGSSLLFFHKNLKILIYVLLAGYLVHGISLAGLQFVHSYLLWTSKSLCDLYLSNVFCYWSRFPSAAATNLFVYCQMAMIVERIFATRHLGKYEKSGCSLGLALALIVVSLALSMTVIMFYKWDLSQSTTYCGTSNDFTGKEVFYVTSVMNTIVAFLTFIGFAVVLRCNKKIKPSNVANIDKRYQTAENVIVLKMLAPQTSILSIFLVIYGSLNGITYFWKPEWKKDPVFNSVLTFVNIIPYYTTVTPLLIWYLLKKHQNNRKIMLESIANDQTDARKAYFDAYTSVW